MNVDEREMLRRVARLSTACSQGARCVILLKREAERLEHEAAFVVAVDAAGCREPGRAPACAARKGLRQSCALDVSGARAHGGLG